MTPNTNMLKPLGGCPAELRMQRALALLQFAVHVANHGLTLRTQSAIHIPTEVGLSLAASVLADHYER